MDLERLKTYALDCSDANACWVWKKGTSREYGKVRVGGRQGVVHRAHRLSYELANRTPIPHGMVVMHLCDNPPCINPTHLRLGTQQENVADRDSKGRRIGPRGESNRMSKLTDEAVIDIRERRASGEILRTIAELYGVTEALISAVCKRKVWAHVK